MAAHLRGARAQGRRHHEEGRGIRGVDVADVLHALLATRSPDRDLHARGGRRVLLVLAHLAEGGRPAQSKNWRTHSGMRLFCDDSRTPDTAPLLGK